MSLTPRRRVGRTVADAAAALALVAGAAWSASSCTEPPIANPCVCKELETCVDGVCLGLTGAPCTAGSACESKHCVCADATCSARLCAANACACASVDATTGACGPLLADGTPAPEQCDGARACFAGTCLVALGQTCLAHTDCGSGHCECADATCARRVCAAAACLCSFGEAGACTTFLTSGSFDFGDCEGTHACFNGSCLSVDAQPCTDDAECGNAQCECADANCATRLCAPANCVCHYGPASDPCVTPLTDGTKDVPDCAGTQSCYGGQCRTDLGAPCTADAECNGGQCECSAADCSARVCAPVNCACTLFDAAAQSCGAALTDATVDPGDCDSGSACYTGTCKLAVGTACAADADCGTGFCECADAQCSTRVCATANCVCGWSPTGECTSPLDDGIHDPQDCEATHSFCRSGQCKTDTGYTCFADADCLTGNCECVTADCRRAVCAVNSCTCKYGAAGACDMNMPAGSKDRGDCDTETTECCGDGTCKGAAGSLCILNTECCSGSCISMPPPLRLRHCG